MTHTKKISRWLVAVLMCQQISVFAQETNSLEKHEQTLELSPFVVSSAGDQGYRANQTMVGSRSTKNLIDIPASISIFNLEQIDDLGATTLHDLIQFSVSGVSSLQAFNDGVNIRGFGVGMLRNGAPARGTNKSMPMYDIERVEVIKGPGAMLTGFNTAIGGAVNYISRKPTATPVSSIKGTFGDHNYMRFQANTSGPLVKSGDLAVNYRVTLGSLDGNTAREVDVMEERFISGAVSVYFNSNTSLHLNVSHFINNNDLYPADFLDITVPVDSFTKLTRAKLNKYSTESFSAGRNRDAFWDLEYNALDLSFLSKLSENGNLRAVYYYSRHDDSRRNISGGVVRADNFTLSRSEARNDNSVEAHSFQIDYLHTYKHKHFKLESTIGVDGGLTRQSTKQAIPLMPDLDTRTGLFPNDDAHFALYPTDASYFALPGTDHVGDIESLSYYFQENLSLFNDRVILVGGLRRFNSSSVGDNRKTGIVTKTKDPNYRVHKYGIVVKLLPQLSAYFTDAQNVFLQSGFTDRFVQADGLGERLRNQQGKLREFGLKFDYKLNERVSMYGSAAYFDMALTNVRTFGTLPESGNQGVIQSERDSAKGWELDYGLRANLGAGHADLIFTAFEGDSAIAADAGLAYVRQANFFVPRKYTLMLKYSWSSGPLRNLMVGGGGAYTGDKRSGAHVIETPVVVDLFARYQFGRNWKVQVNLDNVTNERYFVRVYGTGSAQTADTFTPRLTVGYDW